MALFGLRSGPNIHAQSTVGLTRAGRVEVDNTAGNGTKYDILCALQDGEMTVTTLARTINMPTPDTIKILKNKMRGLVSYSNVE